jgi:hypothetical protein
MKPKITFGQTRLRASLWCTNASTHYVDHATPYNALILYGAGLQYIDDLGNVEFIQYVYLMKKTDAYINRLFRPTPLKAWIRHIMDLIYICISMLLRQYRIVITTCIYTRLNGESCEKGVQCLSSIRVWPSGGLSDFKFWRIVIGLATREAAHPNLPYFVCKLDLEDESSILMHVYKYDVGNGNN